MQIRDNQRDILNTAVFLTKTIGSYGQTIRISIWNI